MVSSFVIASIDEYRKKIVLTTSQSFSLSMLIVACLLTYYPLLNNQFQSLWDDQWVVMNDYTEAGLIADNIRLIFTEFYHGQYAPINQLYYTFLYAFFGYNPFWFHLGSLIVHLTNVLLVYFFIKCLLAEANYFDLTSINRLAFFTAVLVAVHPFLTEAVAWIAASKVVLYACFYLSALLFYLRYLNNGKKVYYVLTLLFFLLSFGAKEQAVTLPVCLLLMDYTLKRNLKQWKVWKEKLPFLLMAIAFGIITMLSQSASGLGVLSQEESYPFYQKVLFGSYALLEYIIKCILPIKLSYLYPFPNQVGEAVPLRFWIYPIAIFILMASLWSWWKKRWIFFGIMFFLIHIAVVLHFIPLSRFVIVADRYVYLASIGLFFLMAYGLEYLIYSRGQYFKAFIIGSFSIYLVCIGVYAHQRTKVWYDTETLKQELREVIKERSDYQPLME